MYKANQVTPGAIQNGWEQHHFPAANNKATCTQGSPGTGLRNVVDTITAVICGSGSSAPTATSVQWNLIDGASGGTNYLDGSVLGVPAVAGFAANGVAKSGGWKPCSAATATTIEFTAAGGANTIESVIMCGHVEAV